MATRTWGSSAITGTYRYDGAKRPISLTIARTGQGQNDLISRTYDLVGNVKSETQTLARSGGSGSPNPTLAYGQTESFTYDAANRVTGSSFDGSVPEARTYTYDADGNRRSVTEAGVTFYYFYDATDALVTKNTTNVAPSTATLCADRGFCYDAMGDLTTSSPSAPDGSVLVATTYTYDPAGHLLTINAGLSGAVSFLLDALGRHWSQTSAGTTTTYAYLGSSDTVSSMSVGANVTTTSLIDAIGDRLGQGTGSAFGGWLIADLHGNIIAAVSPGSSPALLSAYRYDAYGETCGSWSAGSGSIAVPWRFQGRLLESATGGTDLYDFGARSYDPSLGAFTSFDSLAGSAQNPLTLNRYLYANANPATLVDPDGHYTCHYGDDCDTRRATSRANDTGSASRRTSHVCHYGDDCSTNAPTPKGLTPGPGNYPTDPTRPADRTSQIPRDGCQQDNGLYLAAFRQCVAPFIGGVVSGSGNIVGSDSSGYWQLPPLDFSGRMEKIKSHMREFGLNKDDPADVAKMEQMLQGWYHQPDGVRQGEWYARAPGGEDNAIFIRFGNNLLILRASGKVLTIIKGGGNPAQTNGRFARADDVQPGTKADPARVGSDQAPAGSNPGSGADSGGVPDDPAVPGDPVVPVDPVAPVDPGFPDVPDIPFFDPMI
jgi:RHS repeat-associated protein